MSANDLGWVKTPERFLEADFLSHRLAFRTDVFSQGTSQQPHREDHSRRFSKNCIFTQPGPMAIVERLKIDYL
jgi:hypothetical protein